MSEKGERCRSCGAPVIWAIMNSGALAPVDLEPVSNGNIALFRRADGTVRGEKRPAGQAAVEGERLRVSHFATCVHAAKWRKRKA